MIDAPRVALFVSAIFRTLGVCLIPIITVSMTSYRIVAARFHPTSILHARHEGPIPLEPELANELKGLAEAHTHLEAVNERLADRKS